MTEKYFYIEPEKANELLSKTKDIKPDKHGVDRCVYLIDRYAVLFSERIKLRNVTVHDDDLAYFDELIETLMNLQKQGVSVIPILGYCCDTDGSGYIFEKRANGKELYDDAIMKEYYVWAQNDPDKVYLSGDADAKYYLISRTNYISKIPQEHFDKFIKDIIILLDNDILIDFMGKSNFFYDETEGFQFIDIDSHTDYKYGLSENKIDSRLICAYNGFVPCHISAGSKVFSQLALDEKAISRLDKNDLQRLKQDNRIIYEKCRTAMLGNGVSEEQLNESLKILSLLGV